MSISHFLKNMRAGARFTLYGLLIIILFAVFIWFQGFIAREKAGQMPQSRFGDENKPTVAYFHRVGCPHCAMANPVMAELQLRYPEVNWYVVEISPFMTEQESQTYEFWLRAIESETAITPLVVVGPRSQNPFVSPGFGDPLDSREPIENQIRTRLGMNQVALSQEALRFPLFGLRVLKDLGSDRGFRVLGVISGIFPISAICLFYWLFVPRRNLKFAFRLTGMYIALFVVFHALNFLQLLPSAVQLNAILRAFLGFILLGFGGLGVFHFFNNRGQDLPHDIQLMEPADGQTLLRAAISVMLCMAVDATLLQWSSEFASRLFPAHMNWGPWFLYGFIFPTLVCVSGLLYLRYGEFRYRAKRVASLFCVFLFFWLGSNLLFNETFSGFGPFWSVWFGA